MQSRGHIVHLLDVNDHQWKETFISFGPKEVLAVLDSTPRVLFRYSDINEINLGKATKALLEDTRASFSSHKFFFWISTFDDKTFHFGTMDDSDRQKIIFDLMDSIVGEIKNKIKSLGTEQTFKIRLLECGDIEKPGTVVCWEQIPSTFGNTVLNHNYQVKQPQNNQKNENEISLCHTMWTLPEEESSELH